MENIYFHDLESVVKENLSKATKRVRIAVAWINFNIYEEIFSYLLINNVKLQIIVNFDIKNSRYCKEISMIEQLGAKIKMLEMPTNYQYMHNKFCIIDDTSALIGSYNWTINATYKNFESLLITDNRLVVKKLVDEFKYLKSLSIKEIMNLQNIKSCRECGGPIINICVLEQEEDDKTQVDVYSMCNCRKKNILHDFYDISLFYNLISINERFSEISDFEISDKNTVSQYEAEYDFEISKYLRSFGRNFDIPIHVIGVNGSMLIGKNHEESFLQILWKNRFVASQIDVD